QCGAQGLPRTAREVLNMTTRHLVDPQILEMLDMPSLELTAESLPKIRAKPMFTGEGLRPPPFPVREVWATVDGGPAVRLLVMDPPSQARDRGAVLYIHGGGMVVGTADSALEDKPHLALEHDCVVVS